jgi:6-pyruvoyltetrahydropterin/6-carboxytetrahydropterin synthase
MDQSAGIDVLLRAGVSFDDAQLTERGWFFDTDALAERLDRWAAVLGDGPWTARFAFRPTFELVARHVFTELSGEVPQLAWVELTDRTFGSRTRYLPG